MQQFCIFLHQSIAEQAQLQGIELQLSDRLHSVLKVFIVSNVGVTMWQLFAVSNDKSARMLRIIVWRQSICIHQSGGSQLVWLAFQTDRYLYGFGWHWQHEV